MYLKHYGFEKEPFHVTPDPRFLYFTEKHREAMNVLLYGIRQRKGFIQITGEIGAGKTTLCRAVLGILAGEKYRTALILNPTMSGEQMLRAVLVELGLRPPSDEDRLTMIETLNDYLLDQAQEGYDVVLVIDEAQNMSADALEQVRLLSNLETDRRKLLQIVLVGQPELRTKMRNPKLEQLRQRIAVRYHLDPLTQDETDAYIKHRIQLAGAKAQLEFDRSAVRKVFSYSRGRPRLINAVCDRTLLAGFVDNVANFTRRDVSRAIRDLEGHRS
jgi:general secretion pathway protein A